MSTNHQTEPLLPQQQQQHHQDSINSPTTSHSVPQQPEQSTGCLGGPNDTVPLISYRRLQINTIIICTTLIVGLCVLLFFLYKINASKPHPLYIMYNATIYASSQYSRFSTLDEPINNVPKSGQNPFRYRTAMVIGSDGRFFDVGYDSDILDNTKYKNLPKMNMNKAVISPGFADSHGHMMSYGLGFLEPDVRNVNGPSQFLQELLSFCHKYNIDPEQPSDSWLIGGRWDESHWQTDPDYDYYVDPTTGVHPMPHHKILDISFPKLGVALKRVDGHACYVNQVVLDIVQLPDTDPPGGQILRDQDGKPTGVLIDTACDIIWAYKQTQPSDQHYRLALIEGIRHLNAKGLTSVHDASMVNAKLFASHLALPRKLRREPDSIIRKLFYSLYDPFPLRIHAMIDAEAVCAPFNYSCPKPFPFQPIDQSNPIKIDGKLWAPADIFNVMNNGNSASLDVFPKILTAQNGRFDTTATKLMSDGALGSWGAFLSKPYSDKPTTSGIQMYTQEKLNNVVTTLAKQGFQVCTHAIGDGAVNQVLDSYVYASEHLNDTDNMSESRNRFVTKRHRVEHFQIIPEMDKWFPIMDNLGILPSMQSIHAVQDRTFAESRLGKDRLEKQGYLWREIENKLDVLAQGTDFPVSSPDVIENLYAAVTMKEIGIDLPPFLPNNTISIVDALNAVTGDAAYAQHREHEYGRIAKGYIADFIILQQDLLGFTLPYYPDDRDIGALLQNTTVLATYIDGNVIYEHQNVTVTHPDHNVENYEFGVNTQLTNNGEPWYSIRQPLLDNIHSVHDNPQLITTINRIKEETFNYLRTASTSSSSSSSSLQRLQSLQHDPKFTTIFTPINPSTNSNTFNAKQQHDIQLWSILRWLVPSNRINAIAKYLANEPLDQLYKHQFKSFSDTSVKETERLSGYNNHHHIKTANDYRSNILYTIQDNNGNDVYIQPRIPPCIEHMGTREAAHRKHFTYSHLQSTTLTPYNRQSMLSNTTIFN